MGTTVGLAVERERAEGGQLGVSPAPVSRCGGVNASAGCHHARTTPDTGAPRGRAGEGGRWESRDHDESRIAGRPVGVPIRPSTSCICPS